MSFPSHHRTSKDAQTVKIADLIKVVENNKVNLTHEIAGYQVEGQRQMRIMHDLEMERDRLTRGEIWMRGILSLLLVS